MANHKPVRDLDEAIARCERELEELRAEKRRTIELIEAEGEE
jgi:restriction endonuclease S subunit